MDMNRESGAREFLLALVAILIIVFGLIYGIPFFLKKPSPQTQIRVSWALPPAEAEKEFCRDGQKLMVTITENRLERAVCATVAPEAEEKPNK